MGIFYTPFIIPLAGILVAIVAIVSGVIGQAHARRVKAEQRMSMVARGMPINEIERLIGSKEEEEKPFASQRDPLRSLGNARRAGVILCSTGIGLVIFFLTLTIILGGRPILSGAAAGLIPLAIGIGYFVDYNLQKREMSRFGLELEPPAGSQPR